VKKEIIGRTIGSLAHNVLQIGDVADFENEPFGKTEHLI
jgi:hypothetical protein